MPPRGKPRGAGAAPAGDKAPIAPMTPAGRAP